MGISYAHKVVQPLPCPPKRRPRPHSAVTSLAPLVPTPGSHSSAFCLWGFARSERFTEMGPCKRGLLRLTSFTQHHVPRLTHGGTIVRPHVAVQSSLDGCGVVPGFRLLRRCCRGRSHTVCVCTRVFSVGCLPSC